MTSQILSVRFSERVHRLALGIEPMDPCRGVRIGHRLQILVEPPAPGLPHPRLARHGSGLFVMLHDPGVPVTLQLRICDIGERQDKPGYWPDTDRRRIVPRRLRVTIPSADQADALPLARRARRPVLFPGTAYPISEAITGLRGRVEQAGMPVRWARIEARRPTAAPGEPPVGRAQADDRGEFLLQPTPAASPAITLAQPLELDLLVYAALPPNPPPPQSVRDNDGLWDLPVEQLSASGDPDPVADGTFPPVGWGMPAAPVRVALTYGRLLSDLPPLSP